MSPADPVAFRPVAGAGSDTVTLSGSFHTLETKGSSIAMARSLINLVNIEGPGPVAVTPPRARKGLWAGLEEIDRANEWRDWWHALSDQRIRLVASPVPRRPVPVIPIVEPDPSAITVGINVGGHYLRVVRCRGASIECAKTERLGTGSESLADRGVAGIEALADELVDGAEAVGIAWAAPRVDGRTQERLSQAWGCPVSSWNDGLAVAASEVQVAPVGAGRSSLVLKLGTSMAAGVATDDGVVDLPLEMAKCLVETEPIRIHRHPTVGLVGTVRDLVGADPLTATFRTVSGRRRGRFDEFLRTALEEPQSEARIMLRKAAAGVADLARLGRRLWELGEVVLTGRNLANQRLRDLFLAMVNEDLQRSGSDVSSRAGGLDPDLSGALGGALLAHSALRAEANLTEVATS